MVRPTGLEGFRIFFEYWSAQRAWGVSFFNGPPNPIGLPRTPNPALVMVSVAPVSAPVAAKLAQGRQCPRGHVAHRGEVPGVGRVVDGECAA